MKNGPKAVTTHQPPRRHPTKYLVLNSVQGQKPEDKLDSYRQWTVSLPSTCVIRVAWSSLTWPVSSASIQQPPSHLPPRLIPSRCQPSHSCVPFCGAVCITWQEVSHEPCGYKYVGGIAQTELISLPISLTHQQSYDRAIPSH